MYLIGFRSFVSKAGKPCFVVQIAVEDNGVVGFRVKEDTFVSQEVYQSLKPEMILKAVDVKTESNFGNRYPTVVSIKLKEGGK